MDILEFLQRSQKFSFRITPQSYTNIFPFYTARLNRRFTDEGFLWLVSSFSFNSAIWFRFLFSFFFSVDSLVSFVAAACWKWEWAPAWSLRWLVYLSRGKLSARGTNFLLSAGPWKRCSGALMVRGFTTRGFATSKLSRWRFASVRFLRFRRCFA